jgi:hypothetical protein
MLILRFLCILLNFYYFLISHLLHLKAFPRDKYSYIGYLVRIRINSKIKVKGLKL